ncbi:MAG: carboxy-S-adenosyl-L-methionine synthase CmoA [Gammaproteobacteria bacterium]|nr:carboxy-S-adenosyl-L-methionine synthase CmoA [Gammaproteobacteria bacterium]MBT8151686.1 carboxy-S-adenosyl-L-methionine synthase CmoA [Gammaproteobacteria bacterium]NND39389.1 carboxy-S-adenosyl-L-methionine synthase CmoA [Pseudomonadales bacterium]NNM11350.1 carboxy-S-adenosyl-L-methionine synthase CmoA [Pseudomonadales bacterium]RZV58162.1 MAG: carboxy-S-adenosyl-L-methionine synthase CmoA [Pseudomonadales bacterium]
MNDQLRDRLFAKPLGPVPQFTFDASVASVFPDMIERSVPGYATVVAISGMLAGEFSVPGSKLYDLGCSLGATSIAMAAECASSCQVIAVDNSQPMIDRLQEWLDAQQKPLPIQVSCDDINNIEMHNASVVALNYTLQFVAAELRSTLLQKVYQGMRDGGALILSEKIALSHPDDDDLFVRMHHRFKKANGYSNLEVSQKREALDKVLVPESMQQHKDRLYACGFKRVETWFQCFNFVSMVAIK